MTRQEVDAILGERAHRAEEMTTRTTTFTWRQGEDRIVIDFFAREVGNKSAFIAGHVFVEPVYPTRWDRVRGWLGR
jgi:hypothetical protein